MLLTRKTQGDKILVDGVEVPPLAVHGHDFSDFLPNMLPIDFSIVGTAHFYGRLMVIDPYASKENLEVFDGRGERIKYEIVDDG